jgi:serine phosphatase RsbU (regulator of sigma subunit)
MNCGHIQPVVILGTEVRRLEEFNTVVGLVSGATYNSAHDSLNPGERVLLTTDGITEAENSAGEGLGDQGFSTIAQQRDIDGILEYVARYQAPNPAQDDITLIEIRYTGQA